MPRPSMLRDVAGAPVVVCRGVGAVVRNRARRGGWKHRLYDLGPWVRRARCRRGRRRRCCGRLGVCRCGGDGICTCTCTCTHAAGSRGRRRGGDRSDGFMLIDRRRRVDAPQAARVDIGPSLVLAEFRRDDPDRRRAALLCRRGDACWRPRCEQVSLRHEGAERHGHEGCGRRHALLLRSGRFIGIGAMAGLDRVVRNSDPHRAPPPAISGKQPCTLGRKAGRPNNAFPRAFVPAENFGKGSGAASRHLGVAEKDSRGAL